MQFIITLIGRENVGKSILFNRLTKTDTALVSNIPGSTRDKKYGLFYIKKYNFIVVDTPGIKKKNISMDLQYLSNNIQSDKIIDMQQRSDLILFIVDAKEGILNLDYSISEYLRKIYKEKILLVVNKIDGVSINFLKIDIYKLRICNVVYISSIYGDGMQLLYNNIIDRIYFFKKKYNKENYINDNNILMYVNEKNKCNIKNQKIKISIIGKPNVGKSTLLNKIIGIDRMVVNNTPGTTRDSIATGIIKNNKKYILIDTAGIKKHNKLKNEIDKLSVSQSIKSITESDIILIVLDIFLGVCEQDLFLINFVLNKGKSLIIIVNKWDLLSYFERINFKQNFFNRLKFLKNIRIHYISAKYGKGINNLFYSINEAYFCLNNKINTSILTKELKLAVNKFAPPLFLKKQIKLKFVNFAGFNPLTIVIHGTRVKYLSNTYKQYLTNYFHRALQLKGLKIQIKYKESCNPFKSRK